LTGNNCDIKQASNSFGNLGRPKSTTRLLWAKTLLKTRSATIKASASLL